MFKLLNQEERVKVEREYRLRLTTVAFSLASSLVLFTMLSLLPSLILTQGQKESALFTLESAEGSSTKIDSEALKAWATTMKQKLNVLAQDKSPDMPYEWFTEILTQKPSGVRLTNLVYQKPSGKIVVRIHGVAENRQRLLLFQGNLNKSGQFNKIDFPVESLAQETDINFDFVLTPAK